MGRRVRGDLPAANVDFFKASLGFGGGGAGARGWGRGGRGADFETCSWLSVAVVMVD